MTLYLQPKKLRQEADRFGSPDGFGIELAEG